MLLAIIYFILFCLIIKKNSLFQSLNLRSTFLLAIFSLKFLCGLFLGWLYASYYQQGDTFHYLQDANIFQSLLIQQPFEYLKVMTGIGTTDTSFYSQLTLWNDSGLTSLYNDTRTLIRLNAFLRIFSFGYYEVHVLFMSFISFCGLTMLYRIAIYYSPQKDKLLAIAVFCIPSVMLWGSGLMKEPLQIFAMCFALFQFHKLTLQASPKRIFFFSISMLLLFFTRNYIFLAFIPGLIAWLIFIRYKRLNCMLLFICCYVVMMIVALQLKIVSPKYDVALMLYEKQIIYWKNAVVYNAHSLINRVPFAPSAISVIKRSPEAFWLTLSQPYAWQCKSLFYYFSAIENSILILLLATSLFKLDKQELKTNPLFAFGLCFCITLFIIIGFTTPVVGAIVRYKVPGLLLIGVSIVIGKRVGKGALIV